MKISVRERATGMLHTMNMSQLSLDMQAQYLNRADVPMEQKANMTGVLLSHIAHDRQEIVHLKSKNQEMEKMIQLLQASFSQLCDHLANTQKDQMIAQINTQLQQQHQQQSMCWM